MSTLLERMIQRTRAPLSSLEPLSRAQFSGRPAQRLWADSAGESTDTAPDEPGVTAAASRFPRPLLSPQLLDEQPARTPPADGAANPAAAPRPSDAEAPTAPPRPGLKLQVRAAFAGHRGPEPAHTPPEPAAAGHHRRDALQIPSEPAAATIAPQVGSVVSVDPPGFEIERASAATAGPEPAPAVTPPPVPARLVPARRPRALGRPGESPAPRQSTADTGGVRPDVTISIGHIEVRAAPPIEPPRPRPPFRPRVSLDDFLKQRQDRQR